MTGGGNKMGEGNESDKNQASSVSDPGIPGFLCFKKKYLCFETKSGRRSEIWENLCWG